MKTTLMFRFVVLHLILLTLLRAVFYFVFKTADPFEWEAIGKAFWLGLRFDLRLVLLLLVPILVLGWGSLSPLASKKATRNWTWAYVFLGALWWLFYFMDFGFYGYLNSRMNSSVLTNLENPDIAFGMMWQSYPLVWITIGFLALLGLYGFFLQRFVFRAFRNHFLLMPGPTLIGFFVILFVGGLYGNFSQYPLRWSEAFFSPHHFLSHLSLNPVLYFFETYSLSKDKGYDLAAVKRDYPVMAKYLGVGDVNVDTLNFRRQVRGSDQKLRPNVVVIVMESMAMSKTSLSANSLKPTPYLEKIAQESHWFSQYYSPCEGTARNMFSIMTAIPDVSAARKSSSSRNPMVVDQRMIINDFNDYKKIYLLGGSASWANIRGIFSHNIDGIEIFEEGSFKSGRTDVWGISDLDLFIEAHDQFKDIKQSEPFFAVIQTASFHRPYTIPKEAKGFKSETQSLAALKEAGFYSLEQYNSMRFSDYSLGHFFELAKKSPYYANTIFIITGDHGLPDENGANVERGAHLYELEKFHVPLVIHNKKLFPTPTEDTRPAGHADIMTTAAYLAGIDHTNTTFGRNLFDKRFDKERYAFVYNYYSDINEYGLMDGEFLYRYDDVKKGRLYQYRGDTPEIDVQSENPELFNRMENIARGYLNTGRYVLLNNPKARQK